MINTDEKKRLNALETYRILDTLPEKEFDELTELASIICNTPVSLISLLDAKRQWFKSKKGFDVNETPLHYSFCNYAIKNADEVMMVTNSLEDKRFRDNPLVTGDPHIRFYAGAPLITPEGVPLGAICVIDDKPRTLTSQQLKALKLLADRVMAQLELRKNEIMQQELLDETTMQLQAILEQSPDIVLTINKDIKIMYLNRIGNDPYKVLGTSALSFIHPDHRKEYEQVVKEVFRSGKPASLVLPALVPDGPPAWFQSRLSPLKDNNGTITRLLVIATDITAMKALENENRLNYERLLEAQKTARIASWKWEVETDQTYWSPEMYSLFGLDASEELTLQKWVERLHPNDKKVLLTFFSLGVKNQLPEWVEFRVKKPEGGFIWLYGKGRVVIEDGKVISLSGTAQDITRLKEAEEERLNYIKSLEEMLFMTSHKIRKPVTSYLGLCQVIDPEKMRPEELVKCVDYIKASALELDIYTREMTNFLHNNKIKMDKESL